MLTDAHKRAQEYNISLQQYNCKLQSDLDVANDSLKHAEKDRSTMVENLTTLRVQNNLFQEQLTSIKVILLTVIEKFGFSVEFICVLPEGLLNSSISLKLYDTVVSVFPLDPYIHVLHLNGQLE